MIAMERRKHGTPAYVVLRIAVFVLHTTATRAHSVCPRFAKWSWKLFVGPVCMASDWRASLGCQDARGAVAHLAGQDENVMSLFFVI